MNFVYFWNCLHSEPAQHFPVESSSDPLLVERNYIYGYVI